MSSHQGGIYLIKKYQNINNKKNQHKVISEGSCDTEDWSNDHRNKLYLKTNSISQYLLFFLYFLINKCSLVEHKRLLSETHKTVPNFEQ